MENVRISHISNQDRQGPPITVMNTKTTTVEDFRCGNVTQRRSRLRCWCRRHPCRRLLFFASAVRRPGGGRTAVLGRGSPSMARPPLACAIRRRSPRHGPSGACTAQPPREPLPRGLLRTVGRSSSWLLLLAAAGPAPLRRASAGFCGPPNAQADGRSPAAGKAEPRRHRGAFAGGADACTASRRPEAPLSSLRAAAAD